MNVDPGFSKHEWIKSRPSNTFLTSYTLSSFPSRSLLCKSWHNLLNTKRASRACGSSGARAPDWLVDLVRTTSSWVAWASSSSLICLYLHSNEHTGCLVCLQYKLAGCLQEIHHPNLPQGTPYSLTTGAPVCSLLTAVFSGTSFFLVFEDLGTAKRGTWPSSSYHCVINASFLWSLFPAASIY